MNRIYKVVWSKTRNCYVVASELAKSNTKASSSGMGSKKTMLTMAVLAMLLVPMGNAFAADSIAVTAGDGTTQPVYTVDGVNNQITTVRTEIAGLRTEMNNADAQQTQAIADLRTEMNNADAQQTQAVSNLRTEMNNADAQQTHAIANLRTEVNDKFSQEATHEATQDQKISTLEAKTSVIQGNKLTIDKVDADEVETDLLKADGAQVHNDLTVSGHTSVRTLGASEKITSKDLDVTGATKLNTLDVTGATNVNTLTATGATKLNNTLDVTGATNVTDITATGATKLNTLDVTGATNVADITATGATKLNTLDVTGKTTLKDTDLVGTFLVNKDKENQILMNEDGLTIGLASTKVDANGFYAGGHTADAAKAALNSDGSLKAADGAFKVDTDGTFEAVNGAFKVDTGGSLKAAGGAFKVDTDGTFKAVNGEFSVGTGGSLKAADGAFKVDTDGSFEAANKAFTVDNKGNAKANSYKVGGLTYIDSDGINANFNNITNVADAVLSKDSMDAVNGRQLHQTRVDLAKLDNTVGKVGANAAAMANLHPLEFEPGVKWNVAAALGNYKDETALAIGAFYRPNEDVMVNFSTSIGNGEHMLGAGVSFRVGESTKRAAQVAADAERELLKQQVKELTEKVDALLAAAPAN